MCLICDRINMIKNGTNPYIENACRQLTDIMREVPVGIFAFNTALTDWLVKSY